jgi:hypothetical protein
MELGMASGPNLLNILKHFPGRQLGGTDVNKGAIELAQNTFKGAILHTSSADDVLMSDKCADVILADMMYIYVSPLEIGRYLKEVKRLSRNYFIVCEFHHKSWFKRIFLLLFTGYHAYNWKRLLIKHGFYDILEYKLTKEDWPDSKMHQEFATIFLAKTPKR